MIQDRLKQLRQRHGYKQGPLAEELGMTRQNYGLYERGKTASVPDSLIAALAGVYSMPPEEVRSFLYESDRVRELEQRLLSVEKRLAAAGL